MAYVLPRCQKARRTDAYPEYLCCAVWILVEVFTKGYFTKCRVLYGFWKSLCKLGDQFARESFSGTFFGVCIHFGFDTILGI